MVVFRLEEQRFALPLGVVERIIRAVAVTPLPEAPDIMHGLIDLEGQILPVLNLRRRIGLPEREITPEDHFLIVRAAQRQAVLVIDQAEGLVTRSPGEIVNLPEATAGSAPTRAAAKNCPCGEMAIPSTVDAPVETGDCAVSTPLPAIEKVIIFPF